jgi:hypothetical protein
MTAASALNGLLTAAFDVVTRPLLAVPPQWAVALLSLVSGVLLVWLFGHTSNQGAIRNTRERIRGNLLGIHVYRHDLGVILRLQWQIIKDTVVSMRHMLVPLLVALVPVVLLMTQLNLRFAVRPLAVGETAVVKARVRSPSLLDEPVALTAASGTQVETSGIRVPSEHEVAWRVRVTEPGRHLVTVRVGDEVVEKVLVAGGVWASVPQRRTGRGWFDALLHPGEPTIPAGLKIESVDIAYPGLPLRFFGMNLNWLILFFVFSTACGLLFKGILGVEL